MHAYLIVGNSEKGIADRVEATAKKLGAKILPFQLQKIEDARNLGAFVSLSLPEPTAVVIKNVDQATPEALNAFLKNLEEPQENLYYLLTAKNVGRVIPTIVSRCQLVRTNNSQPSITNNLETEKFLKMPTEKKILFLENIRKRDEAEEFVEELLASSHSALKRGSDFQKIAQNIRSETSTLKALRANGNVALQLTNLAILLAN